MKKSYYLFIILLLSIFLFQACSKNTENIEKETVSKNSEVFKINESDFSLEIETIDSIQFYNAKKDANITPEKIEKITDFKVVKKLLNGLIEFEEKENDVAIHKITFRNGIVWNSQNEEEFFVAYYPSEDIILLEGGHSSDISFNLKNGKETEETGNPDYLKPSPNKTFRLNGFYEGQECVTYFIEKNNNGQFQKVIPLSELFNKNGNVTICSAQEVFWKNDFTLFLKENAAYDKTGKLKTRYYKISITEAELSFSEKSDRKSRVEDFIPKGWKEILRTTGDLNGDGIVDEVLVIEDTKPENYKVNDSFGTHKLNLNPRTLLVLFKDKKGGYRLGAKNDSGFIEIENSEMNSCLMDPLLAEGGITIEKGLLKIHFHYWLSCGSYYVNNSLYIFRFQNNRFELIGFDHSDFHRASGVENSSSINFVTKKKSSTTGGNMFDDNESKPITTWQNISVQEIYVLDDLDENLNFNY